MLATCKKTSTRKNTQHSSFTYTSSQFPRVVLSIAVPFSVLRVEFRYEIVCWKVSSYPELYFSRVFCIFLPSRTLVPASLFFLRGFIQIMRHQNSYLYARAPLYITKVYDVSYMRTKFDCFLAHLSICIA